MAVPFDPTDPRNLAPEQLRGDTNQDGAVDFGDLVAIAQNYGTSGRTLAQGDLNHDGTSTSPTW